MFAKLTVVCAISFSICQRNINNGYKTDLIWRINISFCQCITVCFAKRVPLKCTVDLCIVAPQCVSEFTGQESWEVKMWVAAMEDTNNVQIHSCNVFLSPHVWQIFTLHKVHFRCPTVHTKNTRRGMQTLKKRKACFDIRACQEQYILYISQDILCDVLLLEKPIIKSAACKLEPLFDTVYLYEWNMHDV